MGLPDKTPQGYIRGGQLISLGGHITKFMYHSSLIHSFGSLSYDRSKASSKASSPHSAIQSFLLQMRVSSPFLKAIQ